MILILAHHYDVEALYLYRLLSTQQMVKVMLLQAETFCLEFSISYSPQEISSSTIQFKNGDTIHCKNIQLVINRWQYLQPNWWKKAGEKEQEYVTAEMNAFVVGWLGAFKVPVINGVQYGALSSVYDMYEPWLPVIKSAGLQTTAQTFNLKTPFDVLQTANINHTNEASLLQVLVIGKKIIGTDKLVLQKAVLEIFEKAGVDMGEMNFKQEGNEILFVHANRYPAFSNYAGEEIMLAIFDLIF